MSRIRTAWALLILLVVFAVLGSICVQRSTQHVMRELNEITDRVDHGQYEDARRSIVELENYCSRNQFLLAFFVKRDLINALYTNLSGLSAYLSEENRSDLKLELARSEALIKALRRQYFTVA